MTKDNGSWQYSRANFQYEVSGFSGHNLRLTVVLLSSSKDTVWIIKHVSELLNEN